MMNPTIELTGLEVQLGGRTILHGLTGVLNSRAIGLLGPNGAGKSTLINTLLGFHSPSKGSARVLGLDSHTNGKALRSLVGYMPENDAFISKMSGVRFVRYMAEISGLPTAQAMERAHEAFVYVGLGEARYRPVGTYSLGMKQLVKLAQAIVHGPKVLILDEPTNGMDPPARKRLIELIREIREASDICLLLSSHLLRDVEDAKKAAGRYHWPPGFRESVRSSACAQAGPCRSSVRPESKPWGRARSPGPTLPVVSCRENTSLPGDTAPRLTPHTRKLRARAPSLERWEGQKSLPCSEQTGPRTFLR